jgi:hypothetical protein
MSWLGSRSRPAAEMTKAEVPEVEEPKAEPLQVEEPVVPAPLHAMEAEEPVAVPVAEVRVEEIVVVAESVPEVIAVAEVPLPEESAPVPAPVEEILPEPVIERREETVAGVPPPPTPSPLAEPELITIPAESESTAVAAGPEDVMPVAASEAAPVLPGVETAVEPAAEVPVAPSPAPVPGALPDKNTVLLAVASEKSLRQAFKETFHRLGWTLAAQGIIFAAFCILVSGGTPRQGLSLFLAGAVPLFAMGHIFASGLGFQSARRVLDVLEADRLRYQGLLSIHDGPPVSLTNHRQLALWPAWVFLGVLFVAWLYIGLTVWFL